MRQQHHPQDIKTYQKGINSDSNKEILGNSEEGEHIDSLNMRSISMDGDNYAKKKIKGEDSLYPLIDNRCNAPDPSTLTFDGYECMMAQEVNGHIVEIWASTTPEEYPFMRIDGQIVLYSEDFPIDVLHPLQYDKNESCIGGEIYITNNNTTPMVFSIKDLMENSGMISGFECSEKYFSQFDVTAYTINVSAALYKPAFIKQDANPSGYDFVIGTSGLCVGSYSYSYRMVDAQGERTNFSPITELIPVVRKNSSATLNSYPHQQTFSSDPNISSTTIYGNHIRFRYENNIEFVSIEIRRDSWYAGDPLTDPPVSQIIATIPVNDGMNVLNVFDRAEANFEGAIELTLEEQSTNSSIIRRAKSIRYFNQKLYLMNIGYQSKDISGEVTFINENNPGFSTIEKIGKAGHKHVYNATMYKSNMRGEKTGFGVVLFDKNNNASYATEIPNCTNFPFPERRELIDQASEQYNLAYKGVVRAANTSGQVSWTNEVFDLVNAVSKTGQNEDRNNDPLRYNYHDGNNIGASNSYQAMNPTSQNDSQSDLNKAVNNRVSVNSESAATTFWKDYSPPAFGPDYYSQGFALKGIDTYPDWADGFSVVQTEPAKRVVAQGLGFYSLRKAEGGFGDDTTKETNAFWAYFPDLELLYPEIAEELVNTGGAGYKIQCVSPLGYFSEVYNTWKTELASRRRGVDLITYARVIRDRRTIGDNYNEQINPVLGTSSGITDSNIYDPNLEYRYPAYGRFTNGSVAGPKYPNSQNGNYEFTISAVNNVTTNSGRQTYLRIQLTENVYNEAGMNGGSNPLTSKNDADNEGVLLWREPMYVINLIKDANINPGLTTQYKYTGNYIKFKSLVLESNGTNGQTATLVSERWEDCIPRINGQVNGLSTYGALKRFVYVVGADEVEKRWMNVTFESLSTISTILNTLNSIGVYSDPIITNGFDIYGIYTSTQSSGDVDNVCQVFTLNFNETPGYSNFTVPAAGSKVYVKYDNRIPVRVFGGDTYINESVWAVLDNEYTTGGTPKDSANEFKMNAPFPLKSYDFVDTYPVWEQSSPWNYDYGYGLQFCDAFGLESALIRQLITMWTAETRINLSFAFNNETPDKANSDQFFPLINYIPRPYSWNNSSPSNRNTFENNNNLKTQYFDDYGFEWNLWVYGGFRFTPQVNLDYSKSQTTELITSVPSVGFEEETDFCTRIVWSLKRPANSQDTPSIKTFLPGSYFDISDDTGEIKFAWSALSSDKGNNLYALTDSGICLLLVDKRVLSEINANELATVGSDAGGILNQLWIDKTIGMHDQTWRSWAEYSNVLFFCNGIAAYTFGDNQLTDITKTGFFELLNRRFNDLIGRGYESRLSGGFNVLTKEYVMNVMTLGEDPVFNTLIFGTQQAALQCQSTYNYDKYLYYKNHFFGMKNEGEYNGTFELGIGNQINGDDMSCYVTGLSDAIIISDKEFIRIRVNSNSKPEQIYFYKSFNDYKTDTFDSVVDAVAVPLSIKNYFGYECYIPRSVVAPYYRNQGRVLIFKIVSSADEEFLVTSTGVQYKALK